MNNILKNIYKKSDFVLSANFSIPWFPSGVWENIKLLKLKSKIENKLYIWISKILTEKIVFSKVYFVNTILNSVDEIDFSKVNEEHKKIQQEIQKVKNKLWIEEWIEFNIYSEIPRWHWLGFSWVLASLISSSIYILSWKIEIWENDLYISNYHKFFSEIYDFAYKLEFTSKYNNSNWENSFISFLNTSNPILFTREKEKYFHIDLFNENDFLLPFDYFIIFSWLETNTKKIEQYLQKDKEKFDNLGIFLEQKILSKINIQDSFLKKYSIKWKNYDSFFDTFSILNIKLLEAFYEIWINSHNDYLIENFINIINEHSDLISMIEWKSEFIKYFKNEFFQIASIREKLWIVPIYSSKMWWGFLIITKENYSRETINETIKRISYLYPKSYVEYSSSSINSNKDISWIKIEYFLNKNIFPIEFKEFFILNTIIKEILVENIDEALEYKFDILLDTIKNKIYIKWEKLNSNDIHSRSAIIQIMTKLLENKQKTLSNKDLPISTYTKSKSEMWWKIIYPIKKIILEKLWKEILFETKWKSANFYISINTYDLKIAILKLNNI